MDKLIPCAKCGWFIEGVIYFDKKGNKFCSDNCKKEYNGKDRIKTKRKTGK